MFLAIFRSKYKYNLSRRLHINFIAAIVSLLVLVLSLNAARAQEEHAETKAEEAAAQSEEGVGESRQAPESQPAEPQLAEKKQLRKRTHNISVSYNHSNIRTEAVGAESENAVTMVRASYGYEFGYFQPMIGFSSVMVGDRKSTNETTLGSFSVGARINFLENKPGHDVIPYAGIEFGSLYGREDTNNQSASLLGVIASLGLGLDWYPLGEIFAFRGTLYYMSGSGTLSGLGTSTIINLHGASLAVGYVFSF